MQHVAYAIRLGEYLVRRLLQLTELNLSCQEKTGWGRGLGYECEERGIDDGFVDDRGVYGGRGVVEMVTKGIAGVGGRLAAPVL